MRVALLGPEMYALYIKHLSQFLLVAVLPPTS